MASLAAILQPAAGDWLATWLADNLGQSLLWDQPFIRLVESFPEAVLVPLARSALPHPSAPFRACERVRALAARGSAAVIEVVINTYLRTPKSHDDHLALRRALRELPVSDIVDPVLSIAATLTEFEELKKLVELFAPESRFDTRLKDALPQPQQDGLRSLVRRVSNLALDESEGRSLRPSLAVILGAFQHTDDVSLVETWAAEERARWDAYHDDLGRAKTIWERRQLGQYGTSWWWWYRAALALFQCPAAEQILFEWLNSPHLISEGANGLVDFSIVECSLPSLPPEVGGRVSALPTPPLASTDPRVKARADAIVIALERLEQAAPDAPLVRQLLTETTVALANLNDARAIDRLLRLDAKRAGWTLIDSFLVMCRRGAVPPGRRLATALEPFLSESEGPHHSSSNDPWYAVVRALKILLASDEPAVAVERMRRIPDKRMKSYNIRDLFDLLSTCFQPEAAGYLVEISRTMDETGEYFPNLIEALARSSDTSCHARILEIMLSRAATRPSSAWRALQDACILLGKTDAVFRSELLLCLKETHGELGRFLARVVGSFDSDDAASALLAQADLRPIEEIIQRLVSELTEERAPVGQGPGYYLVPRDATVLKRRLAALLIAGESNGEVASRLLAVIRARRVEYGHPTREAIHPDIGRFRNSVVQWPFKFVERVGYESGGRQ
jgi:hypothetical protein